MNMADSSANTDTVRVISILSSWVTFSPFFFFLFFFYLFNPLLCIRDEGFARFSRSFERWWIDKSGMARLMAAMGEKRKDLEILVRLIEIQTDHPVWISNFNLIL